MKTTKVYNANTHNIKIDYGVQSDDPATTTIDVGERATTLFLDPDYFPMTLCGEVINLYVEYGVDLERFTVERINSPWHGSDKKRRVFAAESMDLYGYSDATKMAALLYLIGAVLQQ